MLPATSGWFLSPTTFHRFSFSKQPGGEQVQLDSIGHVMLHKAGSLAYWVVLCLVAEASFVPTEGPTAADHFNIYGGVGGREVGYGGVDWSRGRRWECVFGY